MTKRILNAEKTVEEKVKPVKKEVKTVIWYRVAILKYDDPKLGFYTCVIDKKTHEYDVELKVNFVRWEPAVEVEV
jgi:hypothetical protein